MKKVLSIAGSDSSGGAGIQADLKTFEAFGVYGASVVTVLTAQNTQGVDAIFEVDASFVEDQLHAVSSDISFDAIKVGMLYECSILEVVRDYLAKQNIPVVLDPVFISKTNVPLINDKASLLLKELCAYATLATPNLYEAKRMFGYEFGDTMALEKLRNIPCPLLIKNHRIKQNQTDCSMDLLVSDNQQRMFETPYVQTSSQHGTGCSYSSAIAANLALGFDMSQAIERSKRFIYHALLSAQPIGKGTGPINHKEGGKHIA